MNCSLGVGVMKAAGLGEILHVQGGPEVDRPGAGRQQAQLGQRGEGRERAAAPVSHFPPRSNETCAYENTKHTNHTKQTYFGFRNRPAALRVIGGGGVQGGKKAAGWLPGHPARDAVRFS